MNFSTKVEGFKLRCKMLIVFGNRIAQNRGIQNLEAEILYTIVATEEVNICSFKYSHSKHDVLITRSASVYWFSCQVELLHILFCELRKPEKKAKDSKRSFLFKWNILLCINIILLSKAFTLLFSVYYYNYQQEPCFVMPVDCIKRLHIVFLKS